MKILFVALLAMFTMTANAGIIIPDGSGLINQTFSGNDVVGAQTNKVFKGTNIISDGQPGPFDITFTYIGSEAGYSNDFDFGLNPGTAGSTGTIFNNKAGASAGDSVMFSNVVLADLLNFGFYSNTSGKSVVNGANDAILGDSSFATIFNTSAFNYGGFAFGAFDAIIGFDDSGAGPDGDYDDLVIGINVTQYAEVPEPGTMALMGLGLAGLAASRKRKQAEA